jgi:hypothetical protein
MPQTLKTEPATVADFTLTADHHNPRQNAALNRARQMSLGELYDAGYRHGLNRQGQLSSMSHSPEYRQGWLTGDKARHALAQDHERFAALDPNDQAR